MNRQIFIGLLAEGTTDLRFYDSVIKRTFEDVALSCKGNFEVELFPIEVDKNSFVADVLNASQKGFEEFGMLILCVHTDSDAPSDNKVFEEKIKPAEKALLELGENYCKILTPVIPVQMTESWMLADTKLLKQEIGTDLSDNELGLNKKPESVSDPKALISNSIRIARGNMPKKRRRDLTISDLYAPVGQNIELQKLDALPSYIKFRSAVIDAFGKLNYLH